MRPGQHRIETPIQFFYPVKEDWYPNFPRSTVRISVYLYFNVKWVQKRDTNGMIRIAVSGADDTAMAKDEYLNVSQYSIRLPEIQYWCDFSLPNPLTKSWLLSQGFKLD